MSAYEVHLAVDAALVAALAGTPVGQRLFSEMPPENTPLPFVRYGSTTEVHRRLLGNARPRGLNDKVIDVFALSKTQAIELYEVIYNALDGVRLLLASGATCVGYVSLVGTVPEETGGAHAVIRYEPRVRS